MVEGIKPVWCASQGAALAQNLIDNGGISSELAAQLQSADHLSAAYAPKPGSECTYLSEKSSLPRVFSASQSSLAVGTAITGTNVSLAAGHDLTAQAVQISATGSVTGSEPLTPPSVRKMLTSG